GSINMEAHFILGGQIAGQQHEIYLIYPQGNYISASVTKPYLQIGETKYGKPILDRIITPQTKLEDAARCALVSLDSTMRSNVSVGAPFELTLYRHNSFKIDRHLVLEQDTPLYTSFQKCWNEGLSRAFDKLPRFDWEE
ncbi:MAG: peptidase, partial [Anaerolineae bacterium]